MIIIFSAQEEDDAMNLNDMTFFCVHCEDENSSNTSSCGTIEDVYGHWLSGHTSLENVKPFWFYVSGNLECFYCDAVGNYQELLNHHKRNHSNEPLAVNRPTNREKCAFCPYSGNRMVEHFVAEHEYVIDEKLFNPARLPVSLLSELFSIDIHKKRQCGHCGVILETQHEMESHHLVEHDKEMISNEFFDSKSAYVY